jgi:putative endonuclease
MYFVYILQSEKDGSYYIGHTSDLEERLKRHNEQRSKYTRSRVPWKLIYKEGFSTRSEAMKRERNVSSKMRHFLKEFIVAPYHSS